MSSSCENFLHVFYYKINVRIQIVKYCSKYFNDILRSCTTYVTLPFHHTFKIDGQCGMVKLSYRKQKQSYSVPEVTSFYLLHVFVSHPQCLHSLGFDERFCYVFHFSQCFSASLTINKIEHKRYWNRPVPIPCVCPSVCVSGKCTALRQNG